MPDEAEDLIIHGKDYLSFVGNLVVSVIVQHLQKALKSECSSLLPQVLQDPQPCDCGQSYIEVGKNNKRSVGSCPTRHCMESEESPKGNPVDCLL